MAKQSVRNFNAMVEEKVGKKDLALFCKTITEITELAEQQYRIFKQG